MSDPASLLDLDPVELDAIEAFWNAADPQRSDDALVRWLDALARQPVPLD